MTTIKRGNFFRDKIGRITLISILAVFALVALAACDTANTTNTTNDSSAQPTATTAAISESSAAAPADTGAVTTSEQSPVASDQSSAAQDTGAVTEVQATLKEWAIELSQSEVPAGKVRFTITNQGMMQHNFTVTDSSGQIAATPNFGSSDGPQTLEVDLKPGTYTLICSLPGHAARGQKIDLVVK